MYHLVFDVWGAGSQRLAGRTLSLSLSQEGVCIGSRFFFSQVERVFGGHSRGQNRGRRAG